MKDIKKIMLITLVFCIVSISITMVLILMNAVGTNESEDVEEIGIDLNGTYDENSIIISELKEKNGEVEISIPVIDGLKNNKIEKKINDEIKTKTYERIKDLKVQYLDFHVTGNFANIYSVVLSYSYEDDEKYDIRYARMYFNYDLNTGEEIKFEDIFKKDTDILSIVKKTFYKQLAVNNYYDALQELFDSEIYDYGYPKAEVKEEEFYKLIRKFMNTENKDFYISPRSINVYCDDAYGTIDLIDIADDVVIYNKFLKGNNIYSDSSIGHKDIFNCSEIDFERYERFNYGYAEENLWVEYKNNKMYLLEDELNADAEKLLKEYEVKVGDETEKNIEKYKELAKNNKDKFYIILVGTYFNPYMFAKDKSDENIELIYGNIVSTTTLTNIYTMPKELFESKYKARLIDTYRGKYSGFSNVTYIDVDDDVEFESKEDTITINYKTGNEYVTLDDVFYEGTNYMDVIKANVIEALDRSENIYSEEQKEEFFKSMKYEITGYEVRVIIDGIEDFWCFIPFDQFDKEMLKILD